MVLKKTGCNENYVGLIIILYFDEDQRSCMVVVGFLENIRSVIFYTDDFYFGLDYRAVVMLSDFRKI